MKIKPLLNYYQVDDISHEMEFFMVGIFPSYAIVASIPRQQVQAALQSSGGLVPNGTKSLATSPQRLGESHVSH